MDFTETCIEVRANKSGPILSGLRITGIWHTPWSACHTFLAPGLLTSTADCCISVSSGWHILRRQELHNHPLTVRSEGVGVRGEGHLNAHRCSMRSVDLTLHFCVTNGQDKLYSTTAVKDSDLNFHRGRDAPLSCRNTVFRVAQMKHIWGTNTNNTSL